MPVAEYLKKILNTVMYKHFLKIKKYNKFM
jgi:hypothetical protein